MRSTVFTKFAIPQLDQRLLRRPRILFRYREGLRCKLTLVTGPAGYGKTTNAAMWLHSLRQEGDSRGAWYALDSTDNHYSTFFTRFLTAVETALPGALAGVMRGVEIEAVQPATFANSLAEACGQLPEEVVLVLDDFHLITAPEIHAVLNHLIQYAGDRLHLVVLSRHDPPLAIARLRVQQQVSEIRGPGHRTCPAHSPRSREFFALDKVAAAAAYGALLRDDAAAALSWAREFASARVRDAAGVADQVRLL